jgi:hypothetical protein
VVGAVAFGGGTTLKYLTGDIHTRLAIRRVRLFLVAPGLIITSLAAGLIYGATTDLVAVAVILGGITATGNNLSELESADLKREERIVLLLLTNIASRSLAVLILFAGGTFSVAMACAAISGFAALRILTTSQRKMERSETLSIWESIRKSYNRHLIAITLLDVVIMRVPFVVAPILASPQTAGAFAVLLSAQQGVGTLVTTGIQTVMAIRAKKPIKAVLIRMRRLERQLVALSVAIAFVGAALTPIVVRFLNVETFPHVETWWLLLMAALPLMALNRATELWLLACDQELEAAKLLGIIALVILAYCGFTLWRLDIAEMGAFAVISESVGVAAVAVLWLRRSHSRQPGDAQPER